MIKMLSQLDEVPLAGDKVGYWFAPKGTRVLGVKRYLPPDNQWGWTHWITLECPGSEYKATVVPFKTKS